MTGALLPAGAVRDVLSWSDGQHRARAAVCMRQNCAQYAIDEHRFFAHRFFPVFCSEKQMQKLNVGLFERTHILVQDEGILRLCKLNAIVVGIGGVGGFAAEALVRSGIGRITICDGDVVVVSNKNRQVIALDSTVGKRKVEVMLSRLRDINPSCCVTPIDAFLYPADFPELLERQKYDYVVDCIDSIESKVALLQTAARLGIKTFSSGGAGGKLDATKIRVADIFDTANDALLRVCRAALRKSNVPRGKIVSVFSEEQSAPPLEPPRKEGERRTRAINGTISYLPSMFGLHLASLVVRDALGVQVAPPHKSPSQRKIRAKATSSTSNSDTPKRVRSDDSIDAS